MPKIIKATNEQKKASYDRRTTAGGYHEPPLYGYVSLKDESLNTHECEILFLDEGQGEPNYEVMAPEGYTIESIGGAHSALFSTLQELREFVNFHALRIYPCCDDCDCGYVRSKK